jgi:hypothetical protein
MKKLSFEEIKELSYEEFQELKNYEEFQELKNYEEYFAFRLKCEEKKVKDIENSLSTSEIILTLLAVAIILIFCAWMNVSNYDFTELQGLLKQFLLGVVTFAFWKWIWNIIFS